MSWLERLMILLGFYILTGSHLSVCTEIWLAENCWLSGICWPIKWRMQRQTQSARLMEKSVGFFGGWEGEFLTLECFCFGNLIVFCPRVLCQHCLRGLAASFSPLVLLCGVSVSTPVVRQEGAAFLWVILCGRRAGGWCYCSFKSTPLAKRWGWASGSGKGNMLLLQSKEIVADCGASAMLPNNKHAAPCTVWLVS